MADLIRPLLNGPVTLSISILFGTLVAMTIQTLYNRQTTIHKMLVSSTEEVRELSLLIEDFPEPYRRQGKQLLESFVAASIRDLSDGNITPESLRRKEMGSLLLMLNKLSEDAIVKCPGYLGEVYSSVQRMKDIRSELISTLSTVFSGVHYFNIVALASTLLFVFLLETDQEAMQFLVGFQLSVCWAMLIATYSMLGVVIYDLATPFSGVFSVTKGTAEEIDRARSYALGLDHLPHNET